LKHVPDRRPPARVLIVDDDDLFAQTVDLIADMSPGLVGVGRARNGVEALQLARELSPDLIVMDVEMPLLDGLQATRRLRRGGFAGPVIVVSGSDLAEVERKALRAGATSFVRKSRAYETLISAIRTALEHAPDPDDVVYAA
jgi:DNA-binding NarL/FixJ family response regulator